MHGGKPATAAEKRRMAKLHLTGCRACHIIGRFTRMVLQCSHLTDCGRRRGHLFTICECSYHHQGHLPDGYTKAEALVHFGPSRADGSRPYREFFGSDDGMLEEQNKLLEELK